ncbi:hypothetical protein BDW74DRAFT_155227 [Aspergillus multicolor]|uniref:uncharacterized protein n=1 Tax=Aspergillus multicolor TaxID=41759 RepID=UPI003CCD4625
MTPRPVSFRCKHLGCRAVYQRKEHLTRHAARHSEVQRFSCPYCNSTLARSDLLRRHIRNYHPQEEHPTSRTQSACQACHVRKERCDGKSPCTRCQRRGVSCSRDAPASLNANAASASVKVIAPPSTNLNLNAVLDTSRWIGQDFLDIYFTEFQPTWPILHRATFKPPQEPCVLLQSMVMIGLWIQGGQTARNRAMKFHQRLLSAILEQKSQWYIPENSVNSQTQWRMATYQAILLQLIFALLVAKQGAQDDPSSINLIFRFNLPPHKYDLLTSLVATCRRLGLFHYPTMLAQHAPSAPIALVWVSVEESKRFGLALYKVCRLASPVSSYSQHFDEPGRRAEADAVKKGSDGTGYTLRSGLRADLLTLADLEFCMPDSDDVWNIPPGTGPDIFRSHAASQQSGSGSGRDNRDPGNWISRASGLLCDSSVQFDWI